MLLDRRSRKPRPVRMYAKYVRIARHMLTDAPMLDAVRAELVDDVRTAVRLDACEPYGPLALTLSDDCSLDWVQNLSSLIAEQRAVPLPWAPVRRLRRRFVHGYQRGAGS